MKVTQSLAAMLVLSAAFALSGCKGGDAAGTDVGPTPGHLDSTDNPPPQGDTETPPPADDRPPPQDTQPGPIAETPPPVTDDPPPVTPPPVTDDPPPVTPPPPGTPLPTPSTGSATLTWEAPTQNTDGSALTNLSGFDIYYGTKPSELTESINLPTPGVLTYVIDGLKTGTTYYFSVAATTSGGERSARSSVVSKSI